ncbi:hypothetical protein CQA66_03295 [Helicobacter aurati]|uniref:Uncharacterized protein n=1 Tax=Helicobacter aurati TaxID=137778 RepID=A0A3D8J668_9HELI|nr:hypothetical protein [Helicobacter aurati]RDU72922.1 hypothetical protein CQA66_03295 [Helicobacter aurati]
MIQAQVAKENLESIIAIISRTDANFLFNRIETSKVVLLDSKKMKETKGEFLSILITFIGYTSFANAPPHES